MCYLHITHNTQINMSKVHICAKITCTIFVDNKITHVHGLYIASYCVDNLTIRIWFNS